MAEAAGEADRPCGGGRLCGAARWPCYVHPVPPSSAVDRGDPSPAVWTISRRVILANVPNFRPGMAQNGVNRALRLKLGTMIMTPCTDCTVVAGDAQGRRCLPRKNSVPAAVSSAEEFGASAAVSSAEESWLRRAAHMGSRARCSAANPARQGPTDLCLGRPALRGEPRTERASVRRVPAPPTLQPVGVRRILPR